MLFKFIRTDKLLAIRRHPHSNLGGCAFATFLFFFATPGLRATSFSIDSYVFAGGGGLSANSDYEVTGTIGQPAAGVIGDNSTSIQNGFWNDTIIDGAIFITWAGGDSFLWQINQADGIAGGNRGWTSTNIVGTLGITATTLNTFAIQLQTLNASLVPGEAEHWLNTGAYTWTIATATYGINGFSEDKFDLVPNDFVNPGRGGAFSLEQNGNSLVLRFNPLRASADFGERPDGAGTKINVLGNDLLNGGVPSISIAATTPLGGALSKVGGFIFYTPPGSNPPTDTFTYTLSDGAGHTAVSSVTIAIRGANNAQSSNIIGYRGSPGSFTVSFAGIPGVQYHVQWAPAVSGPWLDFAIKGAGNNGLFSVTDEADRGPQAYYRTVAP
jgi:hypothetical protein